MLDKIIARNGYTILNEKDEEIGFVTSGTMSPSLQKSIGMGYVNSEYAKSDTKLYIQIRNKKLKAQVVKLPFYKSLVSMNNIKVCLTPSLFPIYSDRTSVVVLLTC